MKLTKKGYLIISIVILVLVLFGAIYAYISSQSVRDLVGRLISQQPNATNNNTPTPSTTSSPTTSTNTPIPTIADAEIKSNILQGIIKNPEWRKNEIEILVNNGAVTLKGAISDQTVRTSLEQFVRSLTGVKTLTNNLEVKSSDVITSSTPTPISSPISTPNPKETSDEILAKEVEFACYKTDAFDIKSMKFFAKDGQITLSGKVKSRAERQLAERVAKEVQGVISVTNDLEIK